MSSFCLKAMAIEPFCGIWSRFMAVSNDGKGCVCVIVALLTLIMLRSDPNAEISYLQVYEPRRLRLSVVC